MVLSVIIVNYNVKYFLEQCLCSVQKAVAAIDAEILVIDNNSADGSVEYLQPLFPTIKFLTNEKNDGFGKANNRALQFARGKYILFLNPDTIVGEDCFTDCIAFLENTLDAGAVGIRMIDGSGRFLPESKRSFPSLVSSFYKLVGLATVFPSSKNFNRYALGWLDKNKTHQVEVLAGAFMLVKKEVLDTTNGFDESFFMYGEDVDLSFRIQKAGYTNYYLGQKAIIHFKGESSRKGSSSYTRMFYNAMNVFVKKHYTRHNAALFSAFIQFALAFSAFISFTGSVLRQITFMREREGKGKQQHTLIIGTKEEYQQVVQLLQSSGSQKTIIGRIAVNTDEQDLMGYIARVANMAKGFHSCEIIFCEGQLTYAQIILLIQSLHKYHCMFYSANSHSIVGSYSKTRSGKTIAAALQKGGINLVTIKADLRP